MKIHKKIKLQKASFIHEYMREKHMLILSGTRHFYAKKVQIIILHLKLRADLFVRNQKVLCRYIMRSKLYLKITGAI